MRMLLLSMLTERQQRFVALANELAPSLAERAAAHDVDGSFPHENYAELHQSGYLRLVIPPEYGGQGANVYEMVLAQEQLGRADGATAMATGMLVQLIGRLAEERSWPEPLFATVCRDLATDGGLINSVVTEPELGSVSRGGVPATSATPTDGGWLINGYKQFATGAPVLRFFVVGVKIAPHDGAPQGEVANAIVRAGTPGLRTVSTWSNNLSLRTCGNDDVYFEDVFVPDDWLVGRRVIGAPQPVTQLPGLNAWSLTVTAAYLGVGQAACDAACDYANNRIPPSLGKPIAELPHIQQTIGAIQISLDAARAVLHETTRAWVERPDLRAALAAHVAAAKYLCSNAACTASEQALRVAGGFGLTRALPLERYFRDARAGLFHPPQDDLALAQVARAVIAARK